MKICPDCHGDTRCPLCEGTGLIDINTHPSKQYVIGNGSGKSKCYECNGTGKCQTCNGSGRI